MAKKKPAKKSTAKKPTTKAVKRPTKEILVVGSKTKAALRGEW
jgi:hypothetical protein